MELRFKDTQFVFSAEETPTEEMLALLKRINAGLKEVKQSTIENLSGVLNGTYLMSRLTEEEMLEHLVPETGFIRTDLSATLFFVLKDESEWLLDGQIRVVLDSVGSFLSAFIDD